MKLPEYHFPFSAKHEISLDHQLHSPQKYSKEVEEIQRQVAWETMRSRGLNGFTQYGVMFSAFWIGGLYRPFEASFFRSGYGILRVYDDVGDQDRPVPAGYDSAGEYLAEKRSLIDEVHRGSRGLRGEQHDRLLIDAVMRARRMKIDLFKEWGNIMDTIIFDEERSRDRRICTRDELDAYFVKLDSACIDGALKVVGDKKEPKMDALEVAVRTMFNLRDFAKDFQDGLVNIPGEDVTDYGVNLAGFDGVDFRSMDWDKRMKVLFEDPGLRDWYGDQLEAGKQAFAGSAGILNDENYKSVTRLVLKQLFVNPTASKLNQIERLLAA